MQIPYIKKSPDPTPIATPLPYIDKTTDKTPMVMTIPHMHSFYEVYILTEGERTIYIENDMFQMTKNCLLCIPPQHLHRTQGNAYTRILINFSPEDLPPPQLAAMNLCEKQQIQMSAQETEHILMIIDTIKKAQSNHTKGFLKEKQETLNTCINYLIIIMMQLSNFPSTKYTSPNDYSLRVRQLLSYIHEHYMEKLTLDDLAQMFYVSKATLCNEFKKYTQMSIVDYIVNFRLSKAQGLLVCSHRKNLDDIAQMCGLTSANYMGLMFKKKLGISPNDYRKKNKNHTPKKV